MAADAEARIWAVVGASGTGKGLWIKQQLRELAPARLVVWDFMDEYGDFAKRVPTLRGVLEAMKRAGAEGPLRIRYCPRGAGEKALRREFEMLCELVYAWEQCCFIAEELANVTTPGWAPPAWRKMTTSGRHARVHVIGPTQTPALVDKSFLGNATLIHCGPLREANHRIAVARAMDIDPGRIAALVKLQFLEKDFDTGEVRVGWVTVPGKRVPRGPRATATGRADPGQAQADAQTLAPTSPPNPRRPRRPQTPKDARP